MVLLAHGTILDGAGAPRYRADLLVAEGRIAAIGSIPAAPGIEVADCTGLAVAPGFVDVHSHGDQEALAHPPNKVPQGATTEGGGNCASSSFGDTEELERLCRVVARRGAHYATHLRDYKFRVLEAVDEALELGRRAGVPVQFSHLQVVGRKNWDKLDRVLDRIETAA